MSFSMAVKPFVMGIRITKNIQLRDLSQPSYKMYIPAEVLSMKFGLFMETMNVGKKGPFTRKRRLILGKILWCINLNKNH